MITKDKIVEIISDAAIFGFAVTVKDISFYILKAQFGSAEVAYKTLFGKDATEEVIDAYDNSPSTAHIAEAMDKEQNKGRKIKLKTEDITFDENKAEMIKLLAKIEEGILDGSIPAKDAMKMQVDIRTKLNDKFGTSEAQNDQYVQVLTKFNDICPHCNHEILKRSKEDVIKMFNLVSMNDIKKKYELTLKE